MTSLSKSASPSEPRFIETKLINVAASVARREYMPNLEKCRTINDAREEVVRCDDKHVDLAHKLKTIADELRAAEPRRDEREAFEAWAKRWYMGKRDYSGEMVDGTWCYNAIEIQHAWAGWAARASAAPLPQTDKEKS